jgi:hypothetical protein
MSGLIARRHGFSQGTRSVGKEEVRRQCAVQEGLFERLWVALALKARDFI